MNTLLIPVFLFSILASTVFAQNFTINTPADVVQCEPVQLSWVGGTPGYFLRYHEFIFLLPVAFVLNRIAFTSILPANQPSAKALMSFPEQNGTSLSWTVNITEGEGIFFNLRDSTGAVAQSGSVTIQNSQDNSCINASLLVPYPSLSSSVAASATPGSGSTGSSAAASASATGTGTSGGSTNSKGSSGASSTSSGSASSPSQAAAASQYAPVGTMAMAGVALAFVLAL